MVFDPTSPQHRFHATMDFPSCPSGNSDHVVKFTVTEVAKATPTTAPPLTPRLGQRPDLDMKKQRLNAASDRMVVREQQLLAEWALTKAHRDTHRVMLLSLLEEAASHQRTLVKRHSQRGGKESADTLFRRAATQSLVVALRKMIDDRMQDAEVDRYTETLHALHGQCLFVPSPIVCYPSQALPPTPVVGSPRGVSLAQLL